MKTSISRITIDIPQINHKKLKALAAVLGKSMKEIINESIEEYLTETKSFNKTTLKAIENIEKGIGLTECKDIKELFKKLGI